MFRLLPLLAALPPMPWEEKPYVKPVSSLDSPLLEYFEERATLLYPIIAGVVLALMAAAFLQAWRRQGMDVKQKIEFKREILVELRRALQGLTAEQLAQAIGLERLRTARLLEEMQEDGVLVSHTNTQRLTLWRVKGLETENR